MKKLQLTIAALAAAGTLSFTLPAPALADSAASTRNIILGAAAIAGLAIESNVSRKNAQASRVSGYLPDGSAVYGDGHVVARNGYSYYPGNNGQTVSCSNGNCSIAYTNQNGNGYNGNPNNGAWNSGYYGSQNNGNPNNGNPNYGNQNNGNWNNGYTYGNSRNRALDRDGH